MQHTNRFRHKMVLASMIVLAIHKVVSGSNQGKEVE